MGLQIKAPENVILQPVIVVFGIGGAGGNAVNNMIKYGLKGANFVVANTDAQALSCSQSGVKIQLGAYSTKGLGAGASPEIGKAAALESESEIRSHLEGSNMVFITAGMGGGTGTGAAPEIAKIAKELGILTVGVVTKPFFFEGSKRMKLAEIGINELEKHIDTLIIIPNQNLFRIANENTTFEEAFKMADEVLHAGVRGVTDLMTSPGLVNLDFADVKTVMSEKGKAMMGTGEASGEERAIKAAEAAIANPLLDQNSMFGASGVLINITGGKDMTLYEVDSAANRIREEVGDSDANIIFGSTFNPELEGVIRVSVVATGIQQEGKSYTTYTETQVTDDAPENIALQQSINMNKVSEENLSHDNSYATSLEDEQVQIQQKFEQLAKQVELKQKEAIIAESERISISSVRTVQVPQPKRRSLLHRMWNSLKASGEEEHAKSSKDEHIAPSVSNKSFQIQETPDFLNKNRE